MTTPERRMKNRVTAELKELGCWYCFPMATGYGNTGVPDILGCMWGGFFAIECKSGSNKPTALQQMQINEIKRIGGMTWVVNEESFPQFEKEIRQLHALWTSPNTP